MFILITLFNRVFKNITYAEDRIRNTLEINLPHLHLENLDLGNLFRNISVVFFILLNNRPIYLVGSLEDSLNIFLNVFDNSLNLGLKICNSLINKPDWFLNLDSLVKNVIVTFILFKFERFVDKFKVLIDFLDLLTIKLL